MGGRAERDAGRQPQMILRSSTFLGLALGDRSLSCAEIAVSGVRVDAIGGFMEDLA